MRLFVALSLENELQTKLFGLGAELAREIDGATIRWTRSEQLHLTIKFIGEVSAEISSQIIAIVHQAAQRTEPFTLQFSHLGCFPERGPVRIIWAGGRACPNPLMYCYSFLEDELAKLGFSKDEKTFTAHVTLGRVKEDRTRGGLRAGVSKVNVPTLTQNVERISLYQSFLERSGSRYELMSQASLGVTPS